MAHGSCLRPVDLEMRERTSPWNSVLFPSKTSTLKNQISQTADWYDSVQIGAATSDYFHDQFLPKPTD